MKLNGFERTGEYRPPKKGEYYLCETLNSEAGQAGSDYWIRQNNFKHILKPKEKPMKYKELRPITVDNLVRWTPPHKDLGEYIGRFGYGKVDPNALIKYAELHQHSCWAPWLINHGFIEEIKEEKTYHAGQRFRINGWPYEYLLAMVGTRQASLINPDGTSSWGHPVEVINVREISEAEFKEICCYEKGVELIE